MNLMRLITPSVWVGYAVAAVAIASAAYWAERTVEHRGYLLAQSEYQAQVLQAKQQQLELEAAARVREQMHARELAAVAARYEKEKADAAALADHVIADLRAGLISLRDPGAPAAVPAGPGGAAQPAPGADHGGASGQLSEPAAEFLLALTAEADQLARQLGACQALVRGYTASR